MITHVGTMLGLASNTANVAAACASPAQTGAAAAAAPAATPSAATAATASATPTAMPTTAAATTAAASPTAAVANTAAAGTTAAAATPCPTASAAASMAATATPTATAAAPAAANPANVACDIIVPANPLTAQGLATPFQLTGPNGMTPQASGCTMANAANLGAFVQATILDPATGKLSVYEPLVITQGTQPAAAPVVPTLPANAVVTLDFGFNGTTLTQVGATPTALAQGNCVNGLNGSVFGQVSFCNGTNFFQAAFRAMRQGLLTVPALGTSPKTGQACPSTRSFNLIDQDQSDNVTSVYLLTATGTTAQMTAANTAALPAASKIANGSDNILLDGFVDPTLGCTPFTAPDLTMGGTPGSSQALDELSAAANQAAPAALVPENDPMVLVNNAFSAQKTNLYRSNVGQPPISRGNNRADSPANYCANMLNLQAAFLNANQAALATGASPVPAVGNNLFTFLANRLNMSFTNLNCQNFGLKNPVTVTLDGNGVATAATFSTAPQQATNTGVMTGTPNGQRVGFNGRHRRFTSAGM
ncbi:MAG: hypothetical protein ACM32E_15930 [Gemmatimonadota bacterium]